MDIRAKGITLHRMTTAFFLRHGPTQEKREGRIQGQRSGTLLVRETEHYLAAITPLLRQKNPTVLISSDLERARQTRNILQSFLQLPGLTEEETPLLRERAMGFYEGMLWDEVPAAFAAERTKSQYNFRAFGGENDQDVRERVEHALRYFAARYQNERLCCVTHGGWLRQLISLAHKEGILADGWTKRTTIYEVGIGPRGQMEYLRPVKIEAEIPAREHSSPHP